MSVTLEVGRAYQRADGAIFEVLKYDNEDPKLPYWCTDKMWRNAAGSAFPGDQTPGRQAYQAVRKVGE